MAEDTPLAAPAQNAGTEAPTTNQPEQTAQPEQPAAPAITEEQQAILKYVAANGGLEKIKQTISARTTDAPKAPEPQKPEQPAVPEAPAQPEYKAPVQTPEGFQTMQEFMTEQYYSNLANKPEYAPISDAIRSGEIFKEMAKFNIRPIENGMINQKQVKDFLDLYVKTIPPTSPANPITTTPTVEYVKVGDEITSYAEAMKVMSQKGHPMHDKAMKYIADQVNAPRK